MADGWPFPGDDPTIRARKVALMYRAQVADLAPDRCAELDRRVRAWGEVWATPRLLTHQPDDWLTVAEAADLAGVRPATLREWRRRGRLNEGRKVGGRWHYLARDIIALSARSRRRGRS